MNTIIYCFGGQQVAVKFLCHILNDGWRSCECHYCAGSAIKKWKLATKAGFPIIPNENPNHFWQVPYSKHTIYMSQAIVYFRHYHLTLIPNLGWQLGYDHVVLLFALIKLDYNLTSMSWTSSSGLRGRRRTYLTILKRAWSAHSKMLQYSASHRYLFMAKTIFEHLKYQLDQN
jgi:hypothetical protein